MGFGYPFGLLDRSGELNSRLVLVIIFTSYYT